MPLTFTIEQTRYTGPVKESLQAFIVAYEMQSLGQKFLKNTEHEAIELPFQTVSHLPSRHPQRIVIVPISNEENYFKHPCLGFAIAIEEQYFILSTTDAFADATFLSLIEDPQVEKVCFDYKQLFVVLGRASITMKGPYFDVMIAAYTLDETPSLTRAALFIKYGLILSDDPHIQAKQICTQLL